jgi:hypothetical protein
VWAHFWVCYSVLCVWFCARTMLLLLLWLCSIIVTLFFSLRIALALRGLLCFHVNFTIDFAVYVNNDTGSLMGITLNLAGQPFSQYEFCNSCTWGGGIPHLLVTSTVSFFSDF